jgi:hypothetical protein
MLQRSALTSIAIVMLVLVTNFLTPISSSASTLYFRVGSGYNDNIVHQLVRADNDRIYIFAGYSQYSSIVQAYWMTTPGLPTSSSSFDGSSSFTENANIISTEAVYGGGTNIHVLTNLQNGTLKDHIFSTSTNTFKTPITISTNSSTVSGDYLGSQGVSAAFDGAGKLNIAYWSTGNHVIYLAYTYDASANTLNLVQGPTQIDTSGSANHPALAISPLDNSVTIAWVSQATNPAKILAKISVDGISWSTAQQVSATTGGDPWVSDNAGKNIDQGPSLIITSNGEKHALYMETFDSTGDYGRMHYSTATGSTWTDHETNFYSHAAALAVNSAGDIYMLGHGHPSNPGSCTSMSNQMCFVKRNSDASWATPQVFASAQAGENLDASVSTKWSAVAWNRPETIEVLFFSAANGDYNNTTLIYGQISASASPSATPTQAATTTRTPTATATATSTPRPTATPTRTAAATPTRTATATATATATSTPRPTATPTRTAAATATATATSTPRPAATPTRTATATATATPASGAQNITRQVAAGTDDVNQDGTSNLTTSGTIWLGTGQSTSASYTGLRFTGITIPRNAVITSAYLEVYSTQNQWISIGFQVYGDNTGNSAAFTTSTKPSQRPLTAQNVTYSANTQWVANQWYQITSLEPVIQALVNRSDWQSGNALTLILKGTSGQYGRKIVQSYDGSPSFASRLVITYR